jgi:hypothetical protein
MPAPHREFSTHALDQQPDWTLLIPPVAAPYLRCSNHSRLIPPPTYNLLLISNQTDQERTSIETQSVAAFEQVTNPIKMSKSRAMNIKCKAEPKAIKEKPISKPNCPSATTVAASVQTIDKRKRAAANARERKRMHLLNKAYDRLRKRLADAENKSKFDVLVQAKEYIQALTKICEEMGKSDSQQSPEMIRGHDRPVFDYRYSQLGCTESEIRFETVTHGHYCDASL